MSKQRPTVVSIKLDIRALKKEIKELEKKKLKVDLTDMYCHGDHKEYNYYQKEINDRFDLIKKFKKKELKVELDSYKMMTGSPG